MKNSTLIRVAALGLFSAVAISQPVFAEQKYTVPSTPGSNMPAGHTMQHNDGMTHSQGMEHTQDSAKSSTKTPTETGQSAFAAIAEIVAILNADPKTDWSKVNISALRNHLVDMNEVTMHANAKQTATASSVTFTVTGKGRTLQAIQAMVLAHSHELDKIDGWKVSANKIAEGAVMTISSNRKSEIIKINALGFFGVMTMGAHHQPHHFGMAKGQMVHNH